MGPKRSKDDDDGGLAEFLIELEGYIKDYILEDGSKDPYLNHYIILCLEADTTGQSIFSGGILDRPHLFERYVHRYITEGYQEQAKINSPPVPPSGA